MSPAAPAPLRLLFALGVALLLAEGAVALLYSPPSTLMDKVAAYEAAPDTGKPDVVVVGTCLSEQVLNYGALTESMGGAFEVRHLGTAASTVADWYLILAGHLPEVSRVAAIVVAFGRRDLIAPVYPWESQLMELARWEDLPVLSRVACQDLSCRLGLYLRKISHLYRHRYRISERLWRQAEGEAALRPEAERAQYQLALNPEASALLLDRIVQLAHARGVPLVMVQLPSRPGEDVQRDEANTRALLEPFLFTGEVHYVAPRPPELTAEHFVDAAHTSGLGSEMVGGALGAELLRILGLPPVEWKPHPPINPPLTAPASPPI